MITRRNALKGAVAAAMAAPSIHTASASLEETAPMVEKPQLAGHTLYGPHHPLAQGATVMIPEAPEKPRLAVEEVSSRVVPHRRRTVPVMMRKDADVEDLLRVRLDEEASRFCAAEWSTYKHELRRVEQILLDAGVDAETVKWALDDLDCAAVGLHVTGVGRMLEVGIEAGKALADETQPSPLFLPGDHTCTACHGSGGSAQDCVTCDGSGLVDAPGPALMLVLIPDGVVLEEADVEHAAAA